MENASDIAARFIATIHNLGYRSIRLPQEWSESSQCQCGHVFIMHSFYGATRSECHEGECDCSFYEAILVPSNMQLLDKVESDFIREQWGE